MNSQLRTRIFRVSGAGLVSRRPEVAGCKLFYFSNFKVQTDFSATEVVSCLLLNNNSTNN